MAETVTFTTLETNAAFDLEAGELYSRESAYLAGFNNLERDYDGRLADGGTIPARFIIVRMSDGKIFATDYEEAADDNFYTESPFPRDSGNAEVTFYEVVLKTRTIVEEYYDRAE